ncbi:MAG: hypothetical protein JWQ35_1272 [Bacteriovoracaceae bacterium]|nr:hypothetical protein [Bacteriovoracaceae bacterium]
MNLAVFDIDGTLTNTNKVDGECFQKTFETLHGLSDVSSDWSAYRHSTDSGIVNEVFKTRLKREPSSQDLLGFIDQFIREFKKIHAINPLEFSEIQGATECIRNLPAMGWRISISTGAWRRSAEFKLSKASFHYEKIPSAFAEDAFDRTKIIERSIERAKQEYQTEKFKRIVYIGDGNWDHKAASQLKLPFVRIGKISSESLWLKDYSHSKQVLEALENAYVPSTP